MNTGMFDFNNNDLTQQEVEQYKELFDRANKNESVLFQDVVSFDTKALIEAGIYNPYSNELKREPLIMAGRKMMNVLYEKEKLNGSTISVGEIHYNTGHFHVHFATTEVEPTREMIFIKEHNSYERKGQRSDETLEKMKSTFANLIFDRSSELERLNDLRNGLRSEIKTEMAAPKKKVFCCLRN
ncbi:relaxase MobL [Enterococcus lactis]